MSKGWKTRIILKPQIFVVIGLFFLFILLQQQSTILSPKISQIPIPILDIWKNITDVVVGSGAISNPNPVQEKNICSISDMEDLLYKSRASHRLQVWCFFFFNLFTLCKNIYCRYQIGRRKWIGKWCMQGKRSKKLPLSQMSNNSTSPFSEIYPPSKGSNSLLKSVNFVFDLFAFLLQKLRVDGEDIESVCVQGRREACVPSAILPQSLRVGRMVYESNGVEHGVQSGRSIESAFVLHTLQFRSFTKEILPSWIP